MLSDLVDRFAHFVQQVIATLGIPGITVIALFENLFPPTPSEVLYPLAGKLAANGQISLVAIVTGGVAGSLGGALFYYGLGYRLGETRVRNLVTHYGTLSLGGWRIRFMSTDDYDRSLRLFRKYGTIIVFVARLMPLIHGIVSIPAGVVRMNLALFMVYTALGAALWIAPLSILGWWLGDHWPLVLAWLDTYNNILIALITLAVLYHIYRRFRHRTT